METVDIKRVIDDLNTETQETLIKIDEAVNLIKDGKEVLAYNKMLGIRQKIGTVLQMSNLAKKVLNENNQDKQV
jgi:hypothetical protein